MLVALVYLVAAVAAMPQAEEAETPVWFIEPELNPLVASEFRKERFALCERIHESREEKKSTGPILIPEDQEANICIYFSPRTLPSGRKLSGGWRGDVGRKGSCANQCCEFVPPSLDAGTHPAWFEITADGDCASVPANVINAPTLFKGTVSAAWC